MTTNYEQQLLRQLQSKEARETFVEAEIRNGIAVQLRAIRHARGLQQRELCEQAGVHGHAVSTLETCNEGLPNTETLLKIAAALDVALIIRFEPFSEMIRRSAILSQLVEPQSFEVEHEHECDAEAVDS